jgi:1-acyl-sn-glycerol-3-phosphate acyltransferase
MIRASGSSPHADLPRSDRTRRPSRYLLHPLRPVARFVVQRRFAVRQHHLDRVPGRGPVIFACNHVGVADGPLLAIFAPRPVHALTKEEMFEGRLGPFLVAAGQINVDRFHTDPAAVKSCLRTLRDGAVVGIFPEGSRGAGDLRRFHRGAAYLGLVTGAPIVPVTMLGTREPGVGSSSIPPRGATVDIVYGEPYSFDPVPWPRTKEQVEHSSLLLREHMLVQLDQARALTGRELPGPLPVADAEPDPDTGVTDQGAP